MAEHVVNNARKRTPSLSALLGLTPAEDADLGERDGCCLLAQAAIWNILAELVFGNGVRMSRMFWAGRFSAGLRCLCKCFFWPGSSPLKEVLGPLLT